MYDRDGGQDDIEEILKDTHKQVLSNAEASYLLHDSFKKKMDQMERKKKQIQIHPVFMEFLTYIQKFPHLQFNEEMEGEDIELLKERLRKISKARLELEKFKEITELELVQLYNLCPATVEEAVSWISSLERFQEAGKEMYLKNIIDVIHKHIPISTHM